MRKADCYLNFKELERRIKGSDLDEGIQNHLLRDARDKGRKTGYKEVITVLKPNRLLTPTEVYTFFQTISPFTIEPPWIGKNHAYANFRYFNTQKNYRMLIKYKRRHIEIGMHIHDDDEFTEAFKTSDLSSVVDYFKEKLGEIAPDLKLNDVLGFGERRSGYYSFIVIERLKGNIEYQKKAQETLKKTQKSKNRKS